MIDADVKAALDALTTGGADKQPLSPMLTAISNLVDPNVDKILFWDDSAGQLVYLAIGTNLSVTGTTLNATGGGDSYAIQSIRIVVPNPVTTTYTLPQTPRANSLTVFLNGLLERKESIVITGNDLDFSALDLASGDELTFNYQYGV